MSKYKLLLIDIDGTLLDFEASQRAAYVQTLQQYGISNCDKILGDYVQINRNCWLQMETGKLTKSQFLINRHIETFNKYNITLDYNKFNTDYLRNLSNYSFLLDNAIDVMDKLYSCGKFTIAALTNGVFLTQQARLKASGLDKYFHNIFISEKVGYNKPDSRLYDYVFSVLPQFSPSDTLAVGDSLSSDIAGGFNYNIDTCWLNADGLNSKDIVPTYIIKDIIELLDILL